jgi:hypothetical protein
VASLGTDRFLGERESHLVIGSSVLAIYWLRDYAKRLHVRPISTSNEIPLMVSTLRSSIVLLCAFFLLPPAYGTTLVATFDSFSEGQPFTQLIDGGIRFSDLEVEAQGGPQPPFTIEWAESNGWPQLSPPNYLSTLGYSPGPVGGLGQFRSFRITPSSEAAAVTMDLFMCTSAGMEGRFVKLTALLNDVEVAMTTIEVGRGATVGFFTEHHLLSVSSPSFDSLRIAAFDQMGNPSVVLGATDNVRITLVPEPASLVLLVCGILLVFVRIPQVVHCP